MYEVFFGSVLLRIFCNILVLWFFIYPLYPPLHFCIWLSLFCGCLHFCHCVKCFVSPCYTLAVFSLCSMSSCTTSGSSSDISFSFLCLPCVDSLSSRALCCLLPQAVCFLSCVTSLIPFDYLFALMSALLCKFPGIKLFWSFEPCFWVLLSSTLVFPVFAAYRKRCTIQRILFLKCFDFK